MQYSWLEKMTKEGQVRPEVRDAIYRDCTALLEKDAGAASWIKRKILRVPETHSFGEGLRGAYNIAYNKVFARKLPKEVGPVVKAYRFAQANPLLVAGGLGIGGMGYGALRKRDTERSEIRSMIRNRDHITSMPGIGQHADKAAARFDELVRISPKAAEHPELSKRIVSDRLHSGFTTEDYHNLALFQAAHKQGPSMAGRVAYKLDKNLQKRASLVSPQKVGEYYSDVIALVKEAAPGFGGGVALDMLKTIGIVSGVGLLSGLGAGAVARYHDKKDRKKLEEALESSFSQAMRLSDPNKEQLHANKDKARKAFNTLVHFAPHVAVEPQAARTFMNNIVAMDLGPQSGTLKELADIEEKMQKSRAHSPFYSGLRAEGKGEDSPFVGGLAQGLTFAGTSHTVPHVVESFSNPYIHNLGGGKLKEHK